MTKDSGGGRKDEKKGRVDITLIEETCGAPGPAVDRAGEARGHQGALLAEGLRLLDLGRLLGEPELGVVVAAGHEPGDELVELPALGLGECCCRSSVPADGRLVLRRLLGGAGSCWVVLGGAAQIPGKTSSLSSENFCSCSSE